MGKGDTYPMKININAVTPNTVDIHGQTLAREYAERVLLPLLVASKGENHSGIIQVVQAFVEADLSLEAVPHASLIYQGHLYQQSQEKARLAAEAAANAERCREPSAQMDTLRKSAVLLPSVPMVPPSVLPVADPIHHI